MLLPAVKGYRMNSALKNLDIKVHCMPLGLTLSSWKQMKCSQSRQLVTETRLRKSRYGAQIAKDLSKGTKYLIQSNCCSLKNVRYTVHHHVQRKFYSSSIFVSGREKNYSSGFSFDHGLEVRLSDVNQLQKNINCRGLNINIEQLRQDYLEYVQLEEEKKRLEAQRENIAGQIAAIVEHQKKSQTKSEELEARKRSLADEGKKARNCLKDLMIKYWDVEERVMLCALSLPNDLSPNVPEETKVIKEYFQEKKVDTVVDHYDVLKNSQMVRLSNVGHKAYYLKGRLAELEQELVNHFSQQLRAKNITPILAPEMFKTPVVESGGVDVSDPASVYRLQYKLGTGERTDWNTENLFLQGASQLSFLSYFARMTIRSKDLPLKMFVVGTNYHPENSETENLPGLFGVLQTRKVCMCGVCNSKESSAEVREQFISTLTDIYKQFGLPFRLVSLPASSLTAAEQNRIELQIWIPSLQDYLKIASVSACGEYSSRRLMIRCADDKHKSKPVEMVHCEVTDITRMLAALLEYKETDRQWGS